MTPFPSPRPDTQPGRKTILTDEQKDWLRRWFPEVECKRLMKASGLTYYAIHHFAQTEGLTKSEKGLRTIMKRVARKANKTKKDNGYFESIRGKRPHENAIEATRQRWQQGFHPYRQLSPRRYKQCMERKSEAQKDAIRRERRRDIYGLERKTALHLPMSPYTKSQLAHRQYALKHGYLLSTDIAEGHGERYVIYYDGETDRRPVFERNAEKNGFTFRQDEG